MYSKRSLAKSSQWISVWNYFNQPSIARLFLLSFWAFSALLILLGAGKFLNYLFPLFAGVVGVTLFRRCSVSYMSFVLWLWFLSPLIRRLVDQQSGFMDPSPILLAPYSATVVCFFWFVARVHKQSDSLPFLLASLAAIYGLIVGYLNDATLQGLVVGGLDYLAPIVFGYFLFSRWREYQSYRENFLRTILFCSLICGAYGIYQYFVAPSWDCAWLINTELESMGRPEPLGLRVWSTMHSPGVFSQVLSSSLVFLSVTSRGVAAIPANAVGYVSLLISLVRSSWLGLVGGFAVLFSSLNYKYQARLLVVATFAFLCALLLLQEQSLSELLSSRLETFRDIGEDGSSLARLAIYRDFLERSLFNLVGSGISIQAGFDSGILTLFSDLGWVGAVPYFFSLLLLTIACSSESGHQSIFEKASLSAALTCLFQIGFGPIHIELPGVMMWSFFAMALAAKKNRLYFGHINTFQ